MSVLLLLKWQPLAGYVIPQEQIVLEVSGTTFVLKSQSAPNQPEVVVISS